MLDPLAPLAPATARSALVLVRAPTRSRRREAVGSIGRVQHRGSTSPGPRWRLPDGRRKAMRVAAPLAAASVGIAEASVRLGVTLAADERQARSAHRIALLLRSRDAHLADGNACTRLRGKQGAVIAADDRFRPDAAPEPKEPIVTPVIRVNAGE